MEQKDLTHIHTYMDAFFVTKKALECGKGKDGPYNQVETHVRKKLILSPIFHIIP